MSDGKKEPMTDESHTTVKLRCITPIRETYVSSGKHNQRERYKTEVRSKLPHGKRDPRKND